MTDTAHSYRLPRFEHARVADAMRTGTLSCPSHAPLREVARTMATHHIHCVIVTDVEPGAPAAAPGWRMLSDLDLVGAARGGGFDDLAAVDAAASEALSVTPDDTLERAAQLMTEHGTAHLVVVDAAERPIGMLSTLDLAGAAAWGEA